MCTQALVWLFPMRECPLVLSLLLCSIPRPNQAPSGRRLFLPCCCLGWESGLAALEPAAPLPLLLLALADLLGLLGAGTTRLAA
jgi:hypothetical protein